jgi:enhancing lycopene biosynthesis protein 2
MAKRVAVVLSGCGAGDGSEIRESVITLLTLDRAGAQAVCVAPDLAAPQVYDHLRGEAVKESASPRWALVEAARIARGAVRELSALVIDDCDALIFPGGNGVATVLSNFADKAALCEVHPELVRLLKAALASHRPLGFIGLSAILAARVLGPVAGVRVTLGPRASAIGKHAAVMGADVRPTAANDLYIDRKNRVISTAGHLSEDSRLQEIAQGIEKLTRTVLHLARDRNPAPPPDPDKPEAKPVGPREGTPRATPDRGSA